MDSYKSKLPKVFSSDGFVTFVVSTAIFTDAFIYDLIIPFFPRMLKERAAIPDEHTQFWTSMMLSSFGVCFLISNFIIGAIVDRTRYKRFVFTLGIVAMLASSLMLFLGRNIIVMIVARGLQGASASIVWVAGLATLTLHVEKKNAGWAMGTSSVGMAAGELLGPPIGGVMYEYAGHFATLGLVCAILGIDVVLRLLVVDKSPEPSKSSNDEERPLLHDSGEVHDYSSSNDSLNTQPSENILCADVVKRWINLDLLASCCAIAINSIILFALEATLVNFVSQAFHWSTAASGGVILALNTPSLATPIITGFIERHGPRWPSVGAFVGGGIGLVGLGFMDKPVTVTKVFFVILILVIGSCSGAITAMHHIVFGVATKQSEESAKSKGKEDESTAGQTFSTMTTAWAVGTCTGPLLATFVLDRSNWLGLCVTLACLCFVSAFGMLFSWKKWDPLEFKE
ncbi:hypothetical protein ACN47E_002201 [Coniothyrium glycines]